jgi:hypothetical protein
VKGFLGLQSSVWTGVWPWRVRVERLIHRWPNLGLGRPRAVVATAAAALRGGVRRRVRVCVILGVTQGVNWTWGGC